MKLAAALLAASMIAACSTSAPRVTATTVVVQPGNPFRTGRTLVIPHGGGDGLFPENTLYAYERSMALGADVVDIDVSLSADDIPVAFHDATLKRTTNASGPVDDRTAAELATLDAGWGFERDGGHPFRSKGIGVPTVEQILRRFPTTPVTLDMKDESVDAVGPVCALLRSLDRTHDVYVGTDGGTQVAAFRATCPEVATSGTDDERRAARAARDAGDATFVTRQKVSQPSYRNGDGTLRVTKESLAFSHSKGIAVLTWLVDDPNDMAALIELGVDGIYTSRPDILVKLLRGG